MSKPLIYNYQVLQCFQVSHASSSALAIIFDYFIYLTYRYIQMLTSVALKCQFYKQTFLRQKILHTLQGATNEKHQKYETLSRCIWKSFMQYVDVCFLSSLYTPTKTHPIVYASIYLFCGCLADVGPL